MTPAIAALVGGAVAAGYVPILRGQMRDGEIGIPFGSINPIRVRRGDHPFGFRVAACAVGALVGLVLVGCAAVLVESVVA